MKLHRLFSFQFLIPSLFLVGCSPLQPPISEIPYKQDKWGCSIPPQLIALNKYEVETASVKFGEFSLGNFHLVSDPKLQQIISQGASNVEVSEYLKCGAIKRGEVDASDREQIAYQQRILLYATSNPSPEDWRKFFQENPHPIKKSSEAPLIREGNELQDEFQRVLDSHKPPYSEVAPSV